ncbi:HigA family addiction module antidote protein (plasmid) [Sulfurospirillum diekertiae]|uniref:HigA family addiction module antidote protein n=1 Tax=Sulfurospirillum diekertiae TaxID=1854492 RepID=A0A6G9VUY3_9BACT|nr:HigA family addiction module antitoxin [Sulfurospirillum diekertiae]QIR79975.1 HigA family addiction module antidote protein [Sulfurospirillum diekertiae]QNA70495.1 HigA family addiction module antidote protein [Sulfurospirillum diekertiae]
MSMYNPPHPGQFIKEVYLEELDISEREVAHKLRVAPSTFHRLVSGQTSLTPEMALRLSKTLGRTPESWLAMQDKYSLWILGQSLNLDAVEKLEISA